MEIFWGNPLTIEIKGLDILGVRGIDQAIEEKLVNGITTISLRARYYSILTWAIGSFLQAGITPTGIGTFTDSAFRAFLRRVEFLCLACTALDDLNSGRLNGVLGRDLFDAELKELWANEVVEFPDNARTAMFLTYYGPCRAVGLLKDAPGSVVPGQLTPLGRELMESKERAMPGGILELLSGRASLDLKSVKDAKASFSLHSSSIPSDERELLLKALGTPRAGRTADDHKRFVSSVEWIIAELKREPTSAEWLLSRNYAARVSQGATDDVADSWAEYEWQRRCHFAFEWLLASFCDALNRQGDLSLAEAVEWLIQNASDSLDQIAEIVGLSELAPATASRTLLQAIPDDYQLAAPLPTRSMSSQRGGVGALGAVCLLAALYRQSKELRSRKIFKSPDPVAHRAMAAFERSADLSVAQLFEALVLQCAIVPHLTTTLRKMGGGQQCSLRFFPDGELFRSTAVQVAAGRSGTRLANVLGVLSDLSVLDLTEDAYLPGKVTFHEA